MRTVFKKKLQWLWSLARMEQFSFLIKPNKLEIDSGLWNYMLFTPQSCMEFLTILGTTALMASSFRHTGHFTMKIWPVCLKVVGHFLFHFLNIEILELTGIKHLWTYLHLNVRNNFSYEHACATVIQPKAGVFNLLLCHGPRWESGKTYWPLLT